MTRSTIRTRAIKAAAIAAVAAGGLAIAGPAFADGNPTASGQATVTVLQSISFAFTSSPAFSLSPGVTNHGAVAFNVQTNDNHGYALVLSAPDLQTAGGASIPAHDLSYSTFEGGGGVGNANQQLTNTPAQVLTTTIMPGSSGDQFTQDWTANLPSNTPPGSYATTLTYTVTGN